MKYDTYEKYLDDLIKPIDLFYLEDQDVARELVEIGWRGQGDTLKREDFEARKQKAEMFKQAKSMTQQQTLCSEGVDLANFPFRQHLARIEKPVRDGRLAVIIFIRHVNSRGQEISGYIDYGHRLKVEGERFRAYFTGERLLLPKPSDLSYYNWETQTLKSNATSNFEVIADNVAGLHFKNKRDRKLINVDPRAENPGDKSKRIDLPDDSYHQVVIFEHETRRKN
eukprot:GAFH01003221.1.p1 GENE.GAFH01003221.1~~GAFH01003221.1.p1  ORF type:complete len:252 (-),score=88.30 GAFH01003221.1:223-897(-)